jgi:hypothetical protein
VPQRETLRVRGYREFVRACDAAGPETKKWVRATLAESGERVRSDAATRFAPTSIVSAAGFKSKALRRGVFVGQRLRRTTGAHPEYGGLQMRRALLPALAANAGRIEEDFERAMATVCEHFEV